MTELNTHKVRLASNCQSDSIVDGEGLRAVIWFQGCPHKCIGCHNPDSHNMKAGKEVAIKEIITWMQDLNFQDGITFSGGDPFAQPEAFAILAKEAKKLELNVWTYTGYTFDELLVLSKKKPIIKEILNSIDILVDGRFKLQEKSLNFKFRGSKNQRIINVPKSLKLGKVIQVQKYIKQKEAFGTYQEQYI